MAAMGVGIIGAGAISSRYISTIQEKFPQLDVKVVAARHIESAKAKAAEHGLEACTTDELLAREDIQLVIVLTPVGSHYALAKAALEAGKHVYCEKTLTDDPATAHELAELAAERGLVLGCAPDTFLGSAFQTARKALDDGLVGTPTGFAITLNRDNQLLVDMFRFLLQPGAGAVHDYAVYHLTALVALLGPVARVAAFTHVNSEPYASLGLGADPAGTPLTNPNEARVAAIIQLKSGVFGTLMLDNDSILPDQAGFEIFGTEGILRLTDANAFGGDVALLRKSYDFANLPGWETLDPVLPEYASESRGLGAADLADGVAEGRSPRASAELACHVLDACDAILTSAKTGAFVEVASTCNRPAPLA
ncbi:MAG: Gfo/Idh/MocA family oxidoreductase [Atopobiaceae bacterium]|nr:Gfo/Idh/MocA family oxidoreductase [Atopobiaceae bacterium]